MNWTHMPLDEVGEWFGGGTPSKSRSDYWTEGTVPWLSPKDMRGDVLDRTEDHITDAAVAGSSAKLVPANSVAVVVRSGILERVLPVSVVPFATTLNQDMRAVYPREDIDVRWIAWGLRAFERELLQATRKDGTTVASIEWPRFRKRLLPVPPLEEQQRILGVLEGHLALLDAASASVTRSIARLKALRDSSLFDALQRAEESPGASVVRLGDISRISSGLTPLKSNRAFYEGGTIPWITSGDLHQGVITEATNFVTKVALKETSLKMMPAGTLLLAMYGEGRTRGTAAELRIAATTNQACAAIVLEDSALRGWVRLVLDANYTKLRRQAFGGVQPNLNLSMVKSISVPMPSPEVRSAILARNVERMEARHRLGAGLAAAGTRLVRLRRALLQAAFAGRLSPL